MTPIVTPGPYTYILPRYGDNTTTKGRKSPCSGILGPKVSPSGKKVRKIKAEMGWSKRNAVASEHWNPRTEFIGLRSPLGRAMDPSSWRLGTPRGPAPTNLPGGNRIYYIPDTFLEPTYSLAQNLPCYRYRANADLIDQDIYIYPNPTDRRFLAKLVFES